MSGRPSRALHKGRYFVGAVIAIVLVLALLWQASVNPNAWWFSITALDSYLVGNFLLMGFEKATSRISDEYWIPIRFSLFALVILSVATLSGYEKGLLTQGLFSMGLSFGSVVFALMNILTPPLLYLNFLLRSGFRRVN